MFAVLLSGWDGCRLLQGPRGLGRQQDISRAPFSEAGWVLGVGVGHSWGPEPRRVAFPGVRLEATLNQSPKKLRGKSSLGVGKDSLTGRVST